MLNELHSLSDALSGMSISTKRWHREYKLIPRVTAKVPCIRIWIDANGAICGFDTINAELAATIRKYGNNQNSFPAFNMAPLYRITDKQAIKGLEQLIKDPSLLDLDKITSWCIEDNWRASLVRKVNNCINKSALDLQEYIKRWAPTEENSLVALIRSLNVYADKEGKAFRDVLEACAFSRLAAGESLKTVLTILFHRGNSDAKDSEKDSGTLSVILDYAGWQEYQYPVASEVTTEWINEILLHSATKEEQLSADEKRDAFGVPLGNFSEPMPSVKLPGFDVTLRSMFREQRCQKRYGKFDDDSFPIARQSRAEVKQALEYISAPDKENVTWKKVDSKETVFVYPSKLVAIPLKFASLLGPSASDQGGQAKGRFEKCTEDFIRAFRGLEPQNKPENIRIFSIRKMDKARAKVIFTRNLSPQWYIDRVQIWQAGCQNVPRISSMEPYALFPLEVADRINTVWKQNGELITQGKTTVKRMQYYQGMELLLDVEDESAIRYYLRILLDNAQGLFVFYGNQRPRAERAKKAQRHLPTATRSIADLWPLFGLLLYKNGYNKEDYMDSVAYLIGQLLKVSDELHVMYGRVERKGDIPAQLAGNSMFVSALETPVKALAVLGQRMAPYITWAKRYRAMGKEDNWQAGWYLWLYEGMASKLANLLEASTRFDEFEKAQVFLGYLAVLSKRKAGNALEATAIDENANEGESENEQ